ncbi:protein FAR1-RELATED SEQUENCE 5-like [Tasmannia lanceolata]|uniref:protein FAR1-RELATED SEQUENCE 5-like n=1 Tax=Tasmannia lanceolata TaxID=3420 RepID=UPI0040631764
MAPCGDGICREREGERRIETAPPWMATEMAPYGEMEDFSVGDGLWLGIEEVDAHGLIVVDDGFNLIEDNIEWADTDMNDEDEGGSTPNKATSENSSMNKPYLNQVFDDWMSAFEYYNSYALATEGVKKYKAKKVDDGKEKRERRAVRLNCKSKMIIKLRDGMWVVTTFDDIHSHILTSPLKRQMHRSHNRFSKSESVKTLIDCLDETQMPAARIAKAINSTNDGISGVITPDQVASHLRKKRVNNIGQEAVLVANHLQNKRSEYPNFFFSMELDTDGTFRSMFWADARARDAYITFSDVIVFDVTYKTNRLSLPFAPFTGVNHHRQSTLFGCALLADETEKTFSWLFEQWLTCMHGKAPDAIITDMDPAMKNAIGRVFPDTHHRFCSWHIHRHLLEHVAEMRDSTSIFCLDYNRWFFSKNMEDCVQLWEDLVCKYEIGESDWLSTMWEQREHWVPAYWRNTFTAGMTSGQRSESMNAFFDGYVNSKTSLHEFLDACDRALVQRRKTEAEEDFKSKYSKASTKTNSPLEEEAGIFYTRNMFNIFQDELRDSSGCWYDQLGKDGAVEKYLVGPTNDVKSRWFRVFYDDSDGVTVKCDCAKFEREGILCKHILRIMDTKQLKKVPDHYMLRRWSIQAMYQVEGTTSTRPQVISPVEAVGYVVVVDELLSVQNKSYGRPTILVSRSVKGEEEIPDGTVAVLTPDMPDVLSHVSVRARNSKVIGSLSFF